MTSIQRTEHNRSTLAAALTKLKNSIGPILIGNDDQFPYGWQKAAKGRTVWRIIEEIINQSLAKNHKKHSIAEFKPADSEVGVYDFQMRLDGEVDEVYVNIKSSVDGVKSSKDDISKAVGLLDFYDKYPTKELFIATFTLKFSEKPMSVEIVNIYVMPTAWLPDIYVNPSNNGNLQSSQYKEIANAVKRTNAEFIAELKIAAAIALKKKERKS